ncbi:hypothetical protein RB195_024968 [Necator americanus]|uniref:Uncharacterized protein n=1 Tax=Necator americanus TaxID=51031 RepID=A0ABR1EQG8_NECAM
MFKISRSSGEATADHQVGSMLSEIGARWRLRGKSPNQRHRQSAKANNATNQRYRQPATTTPTINNHTLDHFIMPPSHPPRKRRKPTELQRQSITDH